MITFPEWVGYFGNHLFQIAATIGAAMDRGENYGFPRWQFEGDLSIKDCFYDVLPEGEDYEEPAFSYNPIPQGRNLRLHGFFQSEKYINGCKDLIRKLFQPNGYETEVKDMVSIQVRRGNYLQLPDRHPLVPMDYYKKAIEYMRSKGSRNFTVFSDDLPWCRENFKGLGVRVDEDTRPWQHYRMDHMRKSMSCRHHIMANSTFSWWCAWLCPDPDKIVIAPRQWFGPTYSHFDTKDLYCPEWMVM